MKSKQLALAAALAAALMAPMTAAAAQKGGVDAKMREKGMAEAPAVITAAGLSCQPADARYIGQSGKGKDATNIYEVACSQGLGYVLMAKTDGSKPGAFTCLETSKTADGKPSGLECKLEGNADPKAGLAPFMTKAQTACTIDKARSIGSAPSAAYFEVACQEGPGYILKTSAPPSPDQPVEATSCLLYAPGGNVSCELTDQASQLKVVDTLAAQSGKNCAVKDKRYILTAKDNSNYFEVACQDGKGYVLQQTPDGKLARAIDCANADFVSGGCTLTDSRAAQTEAAGLYTKLAKKAGYDCTVSKYGMLPAQASAQEIVELQCSNRPDGAIAVFGPGDKAKVYDCIQSELAGYRCSFTKHEPLYPKLSSYLASQGKGSCKVSAVNVMGSTPDEGFVEVACADGLPGWVIGFPKGGDTPKELLSCVQAKGIGGGCKLATNKTKN